MADKLHEELQPADGIHPVPAWKVAALADITGLTALDVGRVAGVEREAEPGRWDFFILAELVIDEMGDQPTWAPLGSEAIGVGPGLELEPLTGLTRINRAPALHTITTSGTHVLDSANASPEGFIRAASAVGTPTLSLPSDATYNWPVGTRFEVSCVNANNAWLAAGAGATVSFMNQDHGSATPFAGPIAMYIGNTALCVKVAANTWHVFGAWDRNYKFARATHAFVTIGNDAFLDSERALQVGNGMSVTDTGAGNSVLLGLSTTVNGIGGSFSLAAQHTQTLFNYGGAGAASCTVQTNATFSIPIGFECEFYNNSATGDFTIQAAGGVTFTGAGGTTSVVLKHNQGARITKISPGDTWLVQRIDSVPVNKTVSPAGSGFTLNQTVNQLAVQMTNASPVTVTVDTNANQAISIGFECEIVNTAASTVTVSPAGGVMFFGSATAAFTLANGHGCRLRKTAVNTWHVDMDAATMASIPYITLSATSLLPNERSLGTAQGHSFSDGGPGNPVYAAHTYLTASQTGNYTFTASDRGGVIQYNNSSTPGTFTIPAGILPVGSEIYVQQVSSAQVTIAPGASVSLLIPPGTNAKTKGTNSRLHLTNVISQNVWTIAGDLEVNSAFVTVGNDASLASERALQVGPGLAMNDTGAGNNITLQRREGSFNWTSGSFGFNSTHEGGFVFYTGTGNNTLTIPTNGANALAIGFTVRFANYSADGVVSLNIAGLTFTASGVWPANQILRRNEVVRFTKTATDAWVMTWESPPLVPVVSSATGFGLTNTHNKWLLLIDGHTADVTITIPTDASQSIAIGFCCEIVNTGGSSSWTVNLSSTGVSLVSIDAASPSQISAYDKATLTKIGANRWMIENTTTSP